MNIYKLFFAAFLIISGYSSSQTIVNQIENVLEKLPGSTTTSILIYNPNTKETIYGRNELRPMIPASNTKLFTTAAAFYYFGTKAEFTTKFFTDDLDISDSTIDGNIYVKGFGNSKFTTEQIDSFAIKMKKFGIKKITGKIIGDDSFFDSIYSRDDWITEERANVSIPPVSAIVLDRNVIDLRMSTQSGEGKPVACEIIPDTKFFKLKNSARVTKFRSTPRIVSNFYDDRIEIIVSGGLKIRRYPRSYGIYVQNPPLYAAFVIHDRLEKVGIEIGSLPEKNFTPSSVLELDSYGIKISELISEINKKSENFLAECLFKSLGAFYGDSQGNSFYATQAVLSMIDELNIFEEGTAVVDGSGISRFNEITVTAITQLLEYLYFDDEIFEPFYNSLSITGRDGTLEDRLRRTIVQDNFHGKTGTLRGVSALSGYLTTKSGEELIVSMISEFKEKGGHYHKNIEDEILLILAEGY